MVVSFQNTKKLTKSLILDPIFVSPTTAGKKEPLKTLTD